MGKRLQTKRRMVTTGESKKWKRKGRQRKTVSDPDNDVATCRLRQRHTQRRTYKERTYHVLGLPPTKDFFSSSLLESRTLTFTKTQTPYRATVEQTDLSTKRMTSSSLPLCLWSSFFSQRTFWPPPTVRATSPPFQSSPRPSTWTQKWRVLHIQIQKPTNPKWSLFHRQGGVRWTIVWGFEGCGRKKTGLKDQLVRSKSKGNFKNHKITLTLILKSTSS